MRYIALTLTAACALWANGCPAEELTQQTNSVTAVTETTDDETVYESVDEPPVFPGGDRALLSYIGQHLRYPSHAQERNIQGRVVILFVVTKTGEIGETQVAVGVDPSLNKEAERVVRSLPKFKPGKINGKPVNTWCYVPVTFKLTVEDGNRY